MPLRKYHGAGRLKMLKKKNGKNLEWQDEVGS